MCIVYDVSVGPAVVLKMTNKWNTHQSKSKTVAYVCYFVCVLGQLINFHLKLWHKLNRDHDLPAIKQNIVTILITNCLNHSHYHYYLLCDLWSGQWKLKCIPNTILNYFYLWSNYVFVLYHLIQWICDQGNNIWITIYFVFSPANSVKLIWNSIADNLWTLYDLLTQ